MPVHQQKGKSMSDAFNESDESSILDRLTEIIKSLSQEQQKILLSILDDVNSIDRRKKTRKSGIIPVTYRSPSSSDRAIIKNISVGGVFIETHEAFSVGQEITMEISPPKTEKTIKIIGEIVWIGANGVGVQFVK